MSKRTLTLSLSFIFCIFFLNNQTIAQQWQSGIGGFYLSPTTTSVGFGTSYPYSSYQMTIIGSSTKHGLYARTNKSNGYAGYFSGHIGVSGDIKGTESYSTFNIYANSSDTNGAYFRMYGQYSSQRPGGITIASYKQGDIEFYTRTTSGWDHHMSIHSSGKVSIGTTSTPTSIGGININHYRLFVDGGILTDELRVRTDWADYVFEENYELTSLEEVENHILTNGYLHNTPSAEEVEEEGINVGAITKNQQEKIEEIFLHLIAMEKRVDQLEKENSALKKALNEK